jgi:hypothetical protein
LYALARNGIPVGVGIDEGTAVVVPGNGDLWEVVGRSAVALVRVRPGTATDDLSDVRLTVLAAGDRFDPVSGTVDVSPMRRLLSVRSIAAAEPLYLQGIFAQDRIRNGLRQLATEPAAELIGQAGNGRIRATFRETPQTAAYSDGQSYSITDLNVSIERQ